MLAPEKRGEAELEERQEYVTRRVRLESD
jgi:hypothetical protein